MCTTFVLNKLWKCNCYHGILGCLSLCVFLTLHLKLQSEVRLNNYLLHYERLVQLPAVDCADVLNYVFNILPYLDEKLINIEYKIYVETVEDSSTLRKSLILQTPSPLYLTVFFASLFKCALIYIYLESFIDELCLFEHLVFGLVYIKSIRLIPISCLHVLSTYKKCNVVTGCKGILFIHSHEVSSPTY